MKKILLLSFLVFACTYGYSSEWHKNSIKDSSIVYDFPEKMAKFPGGTDAMEAFIRKNLVFPSENKSAGNQGKVYVQFIVEKDGSITNVKIRRGCQYENLNQEAVNLIKKMPNWVPGSTKGKSVRVKQTLPITFTL